MRVRRLGRGVGAAVIAGAAILSAAILAHADNPPPSPITSDKPAQLRGLEDQIDSSNARRKALGGEIDALTKGHAALTATLIETTRKVGDDQAKIADAEARLDTLTTREDATKRSLEGRRAVIAEVLAALQRMGRKPPPALLVDPDDVLRAIRTSMLLGAVLPGMRAETDALVADLTDLSHTRKAIEAEKQTLDANLAVLASERDRLTALIDVRQAALGKAQTELDGEQAKAKQLAEQASSLKDLIGKMETESPAAGAAAAAARRSDEKLAGLTPNASAAPSKDAAENPARLEPAIAFVDMKGRLPRPVAGLVLRRFGEDDGLGSTEKGTLFSTQRSAVVSTPADGWIVYAGPYRSFGELVILNAGGGYYIVLAGMDRINVDLGQFVSAGEPVAVMGDGSTKTAAAIALGVAQPVLYVAFRKGGETIDPGPWWAKPELQRVRG